MLGGIQNAGGTLWTAPEATKGVSHSDSKREKEAKK
jgi:hypothetical protein